MQNFPVLYVTEMYLILMELNAVSVSNGFTANVMGLPRKNLKSYVKSQIMCHSTVYYVLLK